MAQTSTQRVQAMRERRRQALEAADAAEFALRDVDTLLEPSIRESVEALNLSGEDAGVARLAVSLARTIDHCKDPAWGYRWLAPELLRVLTELHATPLSRSKTAARRDPSRRAPSRLDELRAVHRKTRAR